MSPLRRQTLSPSLQPSSSPMALLIQTCKSIGDSLEQREHGPLLDHHPSPPSSRRVIRRRLDKQTRTHRSASSTLRLWRHPPSGCDDAFCRNAACPTHIRYQQLLSAAAGSYYYFGGVSNEDQSLLQRLQQRQRTLAAAMALASSTSSTSNVPQLHICNWLFNNNQYCGQRFLSSQDLFVHLETHALSNNGILQDNDYGYYQNNIVGPKTTSGTLPEFSFISPLSTILN
ncbi:uncharacterized protein [Lepeophtheirus salmonis]|uniref:Putative LOC100186671 [Ciona intestinalis] n=1 Tax=Lepeophtheirus salmonis TaxID=72036 RepID=A0A0K2VBM8_LEPSM|nr:uncharacterized protein LOC121131997 [Lepeophtheirus salmonis]